MQLTITLLDLYKFYKKHPKSEIYEIISQLAQAGKTILIVSSEIPELLGICDRLYVFHEGRITGQVNVADYANQKEQAQES